MRIQYFSDIHLEFCKHITPKIKAVAPVLCLAGDIGYPNMDNYTKFLYDLNLHSGFEKIFLIAGNHEYYKQNETIKETNQKINELIEKNKLYKVSFLNNACEFYNGYLFVGSTLWSKIENSNKRLTNDFSSIKDITIEKYNKNHEESLLFLSNEINYYNNNKIVVMTHFLPSYSLIEKKYEKFAEYNQCFASNCDHLIKDPVCLWIYGHTHYPKKSIINNVNVVCNPIGYQRENKIVNFEEYVDIN